VFPASGAINGDRKGLNWGNGGGWHDASLQVYPDWFQVDFGGARTITQVHVFSVQDNYLAPVEPTQTLTFTRFGLTAFTVQYWTGTAWAAVPGGAISGNRNVWRTVSFPALTTTAIRIVITAAMDGNSRLVEVEAR
jgi:hypothetical protein